MHMDKATVTIIKKLAKDIGAPITTTLRALGDERYSPIVGELNSRGVVALCDDAVRGALLAAINGVRRTRNDHPHIDRQALVADIGLAGLSKHGKGILERKLAKLQRLDAKRAGE